jgi:hypothetical protein
MATTSNLEKQDTAILDVFFQSGAHVGIPAEGALINDGDEGKIPLTHANFVQKRHHLTATDEVISLAPALRVEELAEVVDIAQAADSRDGRGMDIRPAHDANRRETFREPLAHARVLRDGLEIVEIIVGILSHVGKGAHKPLDIARRVHGAARLRAILQTAGEAVLLRSGVVPSGTGAGVVGIAARLVDGLPTPRTLLVSVNLQRAVRLDGADTAEHLLHGIGDSPVDEIHVIIATGIQLRIIGGKILKRFVGQEDGTGGKIPTGKAESNEKIGAFFQELADVELAEDARGVIAGIERTDPLAIHEDLHGLLREGRDGEINGASLPVLVRAEGATHPIGLGLGKIDQREQGGIAGIVEADPVCVIVGGLLPAFLQAERLVIPHEAPFPGQVLGLIIPTIESPPIHEGEIVPAFQGIGFAIVALRDVAEGELAHIAEVADEVARLHGAVFAPEKIIERPDFTVIADEGHEVRVAAVAFQAFQDRLVLDIAEKARGMRDFPVVTPAGDHGGTVEAGEERVAIIEIRPGLKPLHGLVADISCGEVFAQPAEDIVIRHQIARREAIDDLGVETHLGKPGEKGLRRFVVRVGKDVRWTIPHAHAVAIPLIHELGMR